MSGFKTRSASGAEVSESKSQMRRVSGMLKKLIGTGPHQIGDQHSHTAAAMSNDATRDPKSG